MNELVRRILNSLFLFLDVKEKLKPICDKNVAFTSNDVLEFRKGYVSWTQNKLWSSCFGMVVSFISASSTQ